MAINVITNFNINKAVSIDSRSVMSDIAHRDAIYYKYDGLITYVISDQNLYIYKAGSWQLLQSGSGNINYSATTSYIVGDIVNLSGILYVSLAPSIGVMPGSNYLIWRKYNATSTTQFNVISATTNPTMDIINSDLIFTKTLDTAFIGNSNAEFLASTYIKIYLNSIELQKGVEITWSNATHLNIVCSLDVGDKLSIIS